MSTTRISATFSAAGTPFDPTSVVLSDAGAVYGVKNAATDAVVVAANTAMVKLGVGDYAYDLTDPAPDLTYTASIKYVINGVTAYTTQTVIGTPSAATVIAYPGTLKQLALAALAYLGFSTTDSDIAAGGGSNDIYIQAQEWANLAARELADYGAWPWLDMAFASLTLTKAHSGTTAMISGTTLTKAAETFASFPALQAGDTVMLTAATGSTVAGAYTVASVTSDTVIVLTTAPGNGTATYATTNGYRFDLPEDVHKILTGPSYVDSPYDWIPATLERIQALRARTITSTIPQEYAVTWNYLTSRPQIVTWPPPDQSWLINFAYTRTLPTVLTESGTFAVPPWLYPVLELGVLAFAEERRNKNWNSAARSQFRSRMEEEYRKTADLANQRLSLRPHRHRDLNGTMYGEQRVPANFTATQA